MVNSLGSGGGGPPLDPLAVKEQQWGGIQKDKAQLQHISEDKSAKSGRLQELQSKKEPLTPDETAEVTKLSAEIQALDKLEIGTTQHLENLTGRFNSPLYPTPTNKGDFSPSDSFFSPAGTCFAMNMFLAVSSMLEAASKQQLTDIKMSNKALAEMWSSAETMATVTVNLANNEAERLKSQATQALVGAITSFVGAGVAAGGLATAGYQSARAMTDVPSGMEISQDVGSDGKSVYIPKAPELAPGQTFTGGEISGKLETVYDAGNQDLIVDHTMLDAKGNEVNYDGFKDKTTDSKTLGEEVKAQQEQGIREAKRTEDIANVVNQMTKSLGDGIAAGLKFDEAKLAVIQGSMQANKDMIGTYMQVMQKFWDDNTRRISESKDDQQKFVDMLKQLLQTFMQAQSAVYRG